MEQMYGQLLTKAGYTVDYKTATTARSTPRASTSGEIDVVPEYAATMAEYLNRAENGPDAATIATNDAAATVEGDAAAGSEAGAHGARAVPAADQNGFAVTQEFSTTNRVTTLSELAALGRPVRLAAVVECSDRPFCAPGLEKTYGLDDLRGAAARLRQPAGQAGGAHRKGRPRASRDDGRHARRPGARAARGRQEPAAGRQPRARRQHRRTAGAPSRRSSTRCRRCSRRRTSRGSTPRWTPSARSPRTSRRPTWRARTCSEPGADRPARTAD